MGCPASSAVAGQAGQQLQVNDRAVTRRREIDHLAQSGSILAAGDNENPGLDLARVAGLVEEGPDVTSLVDVVEVSADVLTVHSSHPLPRFHLQPTRTCLGQPGTVKFRNVPVEHSSS